MKLKKIILVGARLDGQAGVILDIIKQFSMFEVIGFIDDNLVGKNIANLPIIGRLDDTLKIPSEAEGFFVSSGDNNFREKAYNFLVRKNLEPVNIIHPSAIISKNVKLGKDLFIGPLVAISNNVIIGNGVIINTGATIDHDNILEDFVNISPGCHTSGRVIIHKKAFLGTGTKVIPDIIIGENAYFGAGTVVINNVPKNLKMVGVPAKLI